MAEIDWEPEQTAPGYAGRPPFVQIPEQLVLDPLISPQASRVYSILAHHVNRTSGTAWPSVKSLGAYMGIKHLPTVRKYLNELAEAGWIEWRQRAHETGRQTSNLYRLFHEPIGAGGRNSELVANATSKLHANATSRGVAKPTTNHIEKNHIELNQTENPPNPPRGGRPADAAAAGIEPPLKGQTDVLDILGYQDSPPAEPKPAKKRTRVEPLAADDPRMIEFWDKYPRRQAKRDAQAALAKALTRADFLEIMAGCEQFAQDPNLPEARLIPHPATWLNGDRWQDGPLPALERTGAERRLAAGYQLMQQAQQKNQGPLEPNFGITTTQRKALNG